jgi:cyclopropane-fatty-acyl-phospholipid synthase
MSSTDIAQRPPRFSFGASLVRKRADALIGRVLRQALARVDDGRIVIVMPSGTQFDFGDERSPTEARLVLRNYRVVTQVLRRGLLGFAECYMSGDIVCDDLLAAFGFYFRNENAIDAIGPGTRKTGLLDRVLHALRFNSRSGSRRNISAHYDLGNDFYRLWLGETWFYSSGIYDSDACSLNQSQRNKCDHIIDALKLSGGERLLEVGCGWGGFAASVASRVERVKAITISNEQLAHARDAIRAKGLEAKVDVAFQDYRDTSGQFERIVSIEMIEAVGEANWQTYFRTLHERLTPGGVGVIQAITISPKYFDTYRRTPDFIQRYIFPGGMLPTVSVMEEQSRKAGLAFETVETFGLSYAKTLADWRVRFLEAWPQIAALGFDERFKRMWLYYLLYCEAGFRQGSIDVGLYRVTRPS